MGQNKETEQLAALEGLIEGKVISEIIGVVKSGKEATVYACRAYGGDPPPLLAAKVYRDRDVRRFSNDAAYTGGRTRGMRRRDVRAVELKSRAGREIAFGTWVDAEWRTLEALYEAGCDVPEPVHRSGRVVLMEYVGDEEGPAPPLQDVRLEQEEAAQAVETLLRNIELMLGCDRVHGDLSPYNALWHAGRVRIIDFPQAVDPRFNAGALALLERDLTNVCRYAERNGIDAGDPYRTARDLWGRFLRNAL
ncbi:MAG TPA: RIO1 family regulatory kinase/ATPase [Dehalococcoidia bacterium]|nr:RIO1 family regulatory kinase/ATPase [Dehalococcoidia bacterium]